VKCRDLGLQAVDVSSDVLVQVHVFLSLTMPAGRDDLFAAVGQQLSRSPRRLLAEPVRRAGGADDSASAYDVTAEGAAQERHG